MWPQWINIPHTAQVGWGCPCKKCYLGVLFFQGIPACSNIIINFIIKWAPRGEEYPPQVVEKLLNAACIYVYMLYETYAFIQMVTSPCKSRVGSFYISDSVTLTSFIYSVNATQNCSIHFHRGIKQKKWITRPFLVFKIL